MTLHDILYPQHCRVSHLSALRHPFNVESAPLSCCMLLLFLGELQHVQN